MHTSHGKAAIVIVLVLMSGGRVAFAEADGSSEFISQDGHGWRVQLNCSTVNTSVIDRIVFTYMGVTCGSFALDWGDSNFDDFDSDFDEVAVNSPFIGPWSVGDGFSANGSHLLFASPINAPDSEDTSEDSCTLLPFFGCWG